MNRRGFFGSLLGLFGIGSAVKAKVPEEQPTYTTYKELAQSCGFSISTVEEIYTLVDRRAEKFSQSSFRVLREVGREKVEVTPEESAYDLVKLLKSPNPEESWGDLARFWSVQMDLTGMALTWMVPDRFDIPRELYGIPTVSAIPHPVNKPDYPDGYYQIEPVFFFGPPSIGVTPSRASVASIPAKWMMRFKSHHPFFSRYDGYSPLTVNWIAEAEATPPLSNPLTQNEIEKIKREFEAAFTGPGASQSGRVHIAPSGVTLEPLFPTGVWHLENLAKNIGRYLTKYLTPFFGNNLIVEVKV